MCFALSFAGAKDLVGEVVESAIFLNTHHTRSSFRGKSVRRAFHPESKVYVSARGDEDKMPCTDYVYKLLILLGWYAFCFFNPIRNIYFWIELSVCPPQKSPPTRLARPLHRPF